MRSRSCSLAKAIGRSRSAQLRVQSVLYGRYWGCDAERPFLHFEVCYYHSVEQCILRGLERFEPGAGGDHKRARGFRPTVTYSAHRLGNARLDAVIRRYLEQEREHVARYVAGHIEEDA